MITIGTRVRLRRAPPGITLASPLGTVLGPEIRPGMWVIELDQAGSVTYAFDRPVSLVLVPVRDMEIAG